MKLTSITDPMDARLDTKADKVDVQNDLGDMVGLLAGWSADMRGGRNLLINSKVNIKTKEYSVTSIPLSPNHGLVHGETVTISLKGLLGVDRTTFALYNTSQSGNDIIVSMGSSSLGSDGVYRATVPWKVSSQGNTHIHIFALAISSTTESTVEWVKIERGDTGSPWTPAPEDVAAEIKSTGTIPSDNPLPPIDHSLPLRLDTTVGTRIFTGGIMIYGDTGWRDISENIQSEWSGWARIKRETHQVRLLANLTPNETLLGKPRSVRRRAIQIPVGFYSTGALAYRAPGYGAQEGMFIPTDMGYAPGMIDVGNSTKDIGNWTDSTFTLNPSFAVDSQWPATLPGFPV